MIVKRIILIIITYFFIWGYAESHSGKANIHVVIDTDCGIDDLRALSLILASSQVNVHAIITSDGALSPSEGLQKVKGLLSFFHHEGVPVVEGYSNHISPPVFRKVCSGLNWGEISNPIDFKMKPEELIQEITEREKVKITYISLGSLYNLNEIVKNNTNIIPLLKEIIWYNGKDNTNYNFSKPAADNILNSSIEINIISSNGFHFDDNLIRSINSVNSIYADKITGSIDYVKKSHSKIMIWDDFVPLFLLNRKSFEKHPDGKFYYKDPPDTLVNFYRGILNIEKQKESKVFDDFPVDTFLFATDIRSYIEEIISNNGMGEWRAGVLTNELHGHLGIYAIIGTKMGLRAREYYRTGIDDIKVLSFAGTNPPISCMNDGIQVSTGATLGHGLINVDGTNPKRPAARFNFRGQVVEISLKPDYWEMIKKDVINGVQKYGIETDGYWLHIRKLAIRYWKDLDRHIIFDIKSIDL